MGIGGPVVCFGLWGRGGREGEGIRRESDIRKVGEKVIYGRWAHIVWLELWRPVLVAQALQPSDQHVADGALSVAGEGCKLVPCRQGYEAVVRSVCVHDSCERRVVILHCQDT